MRNRDWASGVALLSFTFGAAGATASPWTLEQGRVTAEAGYTYSEATEAFDDDSESTLSADYFVHQLEFLAQYGATDYLTVYARPTFQWVDVGGVTESGHSHTDLGLRLRVYDNGSSAVSVQGEVTVPGDIDGVREVTLNSGEFEGEFRLAAGHNFSWGRVPGWYSIEGGYRYRDGPMPDEWHGDVTLGWSPDRGVEVLLQSLNTWSQGSGDTPAFDYFRQHQVRGSMLFHATEDISLELGGFYTWGGQNVVLEQGLFASALYSF